MQYSLQVLCQFTDRYAVIVPSQVKHITPTTAVIADKTTAPVNKLQAGQLISGIVVQQLSTTSVLLSLGTNTRQQVTAETNFPLNTGTGLQLKVIQTGKQPLLQILSEQKPAERILQTSNKAVRQSLPKQIPISDFLSNLKLIRSTEQQLSQPLQQALQTVQAGVGSRGDMLTAEGIKKILKQSGLFLESNLAANKMLNSPDNDFKGKLLQLLGLLKKQTTNSYTSVPTATSTTQTPALKNEGAMKNAKTIMQNSTVITNPSAPSIISGKGEIPDLQKQVESALARIQLNQINSLAVNEQDPQAWLFELPIKDKDATDVFSLKITEDSHNEEHENSKCWSVSLAFDLKGLGDMHARLSLVNEKISATIWAEEEHTFKLLESHIDQLQKRLANVEFIDPHVKCYKGKPDIMTSPSSSFNELINTKV